MAQVLSCEFCKNFLEHLQATASDLLTVSTIFTKKLHRRCLIGSYIRFWSLLLYNRFSFQWGIVTIHCNESRKVWFHTHTQKNLWKNSVFVNTSSKTEVSKWTLTLCFQVFSKKIKAIYFQENRLATSLLFPDPGVTLEFSQGLVISNELLDQWLLTF